MKLTYSETADFCRGLSVLLRGGVGAAEGVYLLAEDESRAMSAVLSKMGEQLDMGDTLSDAMEHAGVFPGHAVAMTRVGEETGRLEQTLASLAAYYDQSHRTTRQIKNALAYPLMILALLLVVIAVLLIKVLPVFDEVYASLGSRLTGVAAGLLYMGVILKKSLPALLTLIAVLVAGVMLFSRNARFRGRITAWYRQRYGDSGIMRGFNNARFARALAMGLCSGLPLEEAVSLSQRLLEDIPGASRRCAECAEMLDKGEELSTAMAAAQLLTPAQTRVFTAGMRGGNGDEVLDELAERMQREASEALEDAVSKVEPTIVLAISLLVGLILLSVMLPLLSLMSAIG